MNTEIYQRLLTTFDIAAEIDSAPKIGRFLRASRDLSADAVVFSELPVAYCVRETMALDACQTCLRLFGTADASMATVECQLCQGQWCSEQCQKDDRYHAHECSLLSKLRMTARTCSVDFDLLRMMYRCAIEVNRKTTVNSSSALNAPAVSLSSMISHHKHAEPRWLEAVDEAAHELKQIASLSLRPEQLVRLASRINANAHAIADAQGTYADVGLGMFPLCAIINHSCLPNCIYKGALDPTTQLPVLQIRTLRPICAGEELTLSYIDVYQGRHDRQAQLLETKHFWCECLRCTNFSDGDRAITGWMCTMCQGLNYDDTDGGYQLCDHVNLDQVQKCGADLEHAYQSALGFVDRPRPFFDLAYRAFKQMLGKYEQGNLDLVPHALHRTVFQARIYLMNCCRALLETEEAERLRLLLVSTLKELVGAGQCPMNWPDHASFHVSDEPEK